MARPKKEIISKQQYADVSKDAGGTIKRHGALLTEIAALLAKSEDFSPAILDQLDKVNIAALKSAVREMSETIVKRGESYFDEQKAALGERKLRLNRRGKESDDIEIVDPDLLIGTAKV